MGLQLKADTIIRKYSQNHTLLDYVAPDPRYRYDGASIAYFDTVEDAGKIYRNPAVLDVAEADELLMGTEPRSEEHTSELQSLMRISYAVFCLKKKKTYKHNTGNN